MSALAIYQANDGQARWSTFSKVRANRVTTNPSLLDFTAQTPIASSYGLVQILYSTAIAPMAWKGIDGAKNPSHLFDTPSNTAAGGGSLELGSGYLRRMFTKANPNVSVANPTFGGASDFEAAFSRAFNRYNSGKEAGAYGPKVMLNAAAFVPVPATAIFP